MIIRPGVYAVGLSVLWALVAMVALQTPPSGVVQAIVLSYVLLGAGLPTGFALARWPQLEKTAAPSEAVLFLLTFATSFASSAIGGQPLIWTAEWTPTRHIVATMATGMLFALLAHSFGRRGATR